MGRTFIDTLFLMPMQWQQTSSCVIATTLSEPMSSNRFSHHAEADPLKISLFAGI